MLLFFPRGVLDEILNVIESVSEGFPSYFFIMDILPESCLFGIMLYQDRLLTFHHWPKQIIPDKYSLAQAGFYYTGQSDFTICFACGLKVNQWERQNKPWYEHIRLSPDCLYLKMFGYVESCLD